MSDNWLPGQDIPEYLKNIQNPVGIEIGTDGGVTTKYLLESLPNLILHGVDPYTPYIDWGGNLFAWDGGQIKDCNSAFFNFMQKVEPYSNRYIHHKTTSDEALKHFANESMDFIFIDGLHSYEQVLKDCVNYYPKLKRGGLYCGHDIGTVQDVTNAVSMFAGSLGLKEIGIMRQNVWFWHKQ